MFVIYTILYSIALLIIAPFEYFKRPAPLRGRWLRERFGRPGLRAKTGRTVWIHAVSVGEVAASVALITKLKEKHPQSDIVISTVTDTGQRIADERVGRLARVIYVPFDLPFCVTAAVSAIRPDLFIIMETEIWPNIIRGLAMRNVPVILMNGRISEKSFKGYRKARFFIAPILRHFEALCMQDERYAERIRLLGAPADKVCVTGNFKFDMRPSTEIPEWTGMLRGRKVIAGSTHRAEEDIVLDAYAQLLGVAPDLNLILAPRHPERFAEVEELVKKRNLRYVKRSELKAGDMENVKADNREQRNRREADRSNPGAAGMVVLLDVMGELAAVYGAADIAIMGGSFIEHGGQNPLEPAYWGKAIICGPHMENFPFIGDFYEQGAAMAADHSGLAKILHELLRSPEICRKMGKAARALYDCNTGATDRALQIIGRYI